MGNEANPQATDPQAQNPQNPAEPARPAASSEDAREPGAQAQTEQNAGSTVNRFKYERDLAKAQKQIDDLTARNKQLEEQNDGWKSVRDDLDKFKAEQEAEKTEKALKAAGCIDVKAATARLDDFDGDVEKLKEGASYLFASSNNSQSTGGSSKGAPDPEDERSKNMRSIMGLDDKK